MINYLLAFLLITATVVQAQTATKPRARDAGIPFNGTPGEYNAITDVPGVLVGYKTLIEGKGKWMLGSGPIRTGVTVILPAGKTTKSYPAGYFIFNGDGEMTGIPYIHDYGTGCGPIGITNTNSVGVVRDAIGSWSHQHFASKNPLDFAFGLPIVGETWDGVLNDINGLHVRKEHVMAALDGASSGAIQEGNVGGGTGMICYAFKGGTGTASRVIKIGNQTYTVGVLVQANFGRRPDLLIAGLPVGQEITDLMPVLNEKDGSIIAIVGTDVPLVSSQLNLVAKRVTMGIARTGTYGTNSSGDIFMAFSTQTAEQDTLTKLTTYRSVDKSSLDVVFKATVEATEEAIINALVAAETMDGINGHKVYALPHDRLQRVMKKYNRLEKKD
ncbi:DmpA family aminopeptidase [Spirosoma endbachense]|uniref:S58 family peptidase n=1 Tax=Spirosoma endbachense TaxID=2666025 RepID=A0A6P1VQ48_9BACT|nr:P1 family peptidase [Spirosoma endbachense]QHV94744.1 S58 family peptidase [Spirosoma endbachense]